MSSESPAPEDPLASKGSLASQDILAANESLTSKDPLTSKGPVASKDPLHGVTLEAIVTELVENLGWARMGEEIDIRCFKYDPSVKSSLQFLRRTPWARAKVEQLYIASRLH